MSERERVEMKGSPSASVSVADWQARADELRTLMLEAGHDPAEVADDLRTAFGDITFVDAQGRSWRHDGLVWWWWQDPAWAQGTPPPALFLESVTFEMEPEVQPSVESVPSGEPTSAVPASYRATHRVPAGGMWAWAEPDAASQAAALLDPWLDVELVEPRVDGWARVRCSNGWEAWVDGRALDGPPTGAF